MTGILIRKGTACSEGTSREKERVNQKCRPAQRVRNYRQTDLSKISV